MQLQGQTYMSPLVRSRVGATMGYFGYGISASAGICFMLRNNMRIANMHWSGSILLFCGVLGTMLGAKILDHETQYPAKALCYTAFVGLMGVSMLPLI
jgi:hypothetical protein